MMRNFLIGYNNGGANDKVAVREAWTHINRLARAVAWKAGRSDLGEDLNQEIWMRISNIADTYDPTYPAESYILGWMRRIIMELGRKNMLALELDDIKEDLNECLRATAATEDSVDRKIALNAIELRMNNKNSTQISGKESMESPKLGHVPFVKVTRGPVVSNTEPQPLAQPPLAVKQKGLGKPLGLDHKEVRDARLFLDMTQQDFARDIGVPTPTLVSYECGRTQRVPLHILEAVRNLIKTNGDILPWRKKFEGVPIKVILEGWAERLTCDPEDMVTMAAMTGTTVSTISRWRSGEVVPRLRQLIVYDLTVERNAKRLNKSDSQIKNMVKMPSRASSTASAN